MAETFNIAKANNCFSGTDFQLEFTTPDDYSAYALAWYLHRLPVLSDSAPLISKTSGDGIAATSNLVTVSVSASDTEGIEGDDSPRFWHELWRTDVGSKQILAAGTFVLRQSGGGS